MDSINLQIHNNIDGWQVDKLFKFHDIVIDGKENLGPPSIIPPTIKTILDGGIDISSPVIDHATMNQSNGIMPRQDKLVSSGISIYLPVKLRNKVAAEIRGRSSFAYHREKPDVSRRCLIPFDSCKVNCIEEHQNPHHLRVFNPLKNPVQVYGTNCNETLNQTLPEGAKRRERLFQIVFRAVRPNRTIPLYLKQKAVEMRRSTSYNAYVIDVGTSSMIHPAHPRHHIDYGEVGLIETVDQDLYEIHGGVIDSTYEGPISLIIHPTKLYSDDKLKEHKKETINNPRGGIHPPISMWIQQGDHVANMHVYDSYKICNDNLNTLYRVKDAITAIGYDKADIRREKGFGSTGIIG